MTGITARLVSIHLAPGFGPLTLEVDDRPVGPLAALSSRTDSVLEGAYQTLYRDSNGFAASSAAVQLRSDEWRFLVVTPTTAYQEALARFPLGTQGCLVIAPALSTGSYDVYITPGTPGLGTAIEVRQNVPGTGRAEQWVVTPGTYRVVVTPAGGSTVLLDSGQFAVSASSATFYGLYRDSGGTPQGQLLTVAVP